ncbi:hypothetical protein SpCBS45565_g04949 [Spizellomyces sp. 'palustris']|nr:hypothetical protein SpCBS45565_g04949 [Spizellomyces sp. 'palustris']
MTQPPVFGAPTAPIESLSQISTFRRGRQQPGQCQKCLGYGHWTYECKSTRPYVSRPTRTQQLSKPILPSAMVKKDPTGLRRSQKGLADEILRKKRRERGEDSSESGSDSDSDSESSSSSSSSSSSDSSSDSSDSSSSDSDSSSSESESEDDKDKRSKKRRRRS